MNHEDLSELPVAILLGLYLSQIYEMELLRQEMKFTNERPGEFFSQIMDVEFRITDARLRLTNSEAEISRRMGKF